MVLKETHPSGISEKIVKKVVARRGRLHAFETIEPAKTALVVIDLDEGTVGRGDKDTTPLIISNINAVAATLRRSGGVTISVASRLPATPPSSTPKC
jgi:ureidoacrylate peracid hydrolase